MIKNKIGIETLILAMLLVSIVFVPAVSAQADISQNKEYADAIDISNKKSISKEDLKKVSENVNVLKETDNEKIVSFKKQDGSIGYAISWKDEENPNRVNFAFVDQNELVSKKLVSASSLNDSSAVAAAISAARTSFWHGSYIEQYGDAITGGIHIYFSPTDASYVADVGTAAAAALAAIIGSFLSPTASVILAALVTIGVQTVYWMEQNSDGSLDVRIPYANVASMILTGHIYMKIGSHWYTV
ncbi:hypothetical protein SAMN02910340_00242 [Methanosarcina thermophila]|jgi:hypothetical protein|uniref:Uncharacterized protein n=3 Tax=Methanosarcina thermophila TaxID=2210 RepID=A0A1I6X673_METTE|nr:hypothetical protein [Methanosarcina thermophila]AKB13325.1 hypothetical protein MSTHT_1567 [Methanosarcina thermophila TM-1]AKB16040.1 hypothetical protein MSTHC_1722 [Methanosarcina thermophila CHTI-55]NLU57949.1 hypothetical protein [Methanosarcina thermophila]SFT33760.1 hypothetical protein SAMN02910340_00242 [Methanosarcina thermophila]BAW28320.1 conserved hypothetical protein [Methanosarcina thermophila]